jgi:hypothetical protein
MMTFEINTMVYIASPCKASTRAGVEKNMRAARLYCESANLAMGTKAVAPHACLPEMLDDNEPWARDLALFFGKELLKHCSAVLVCGTRLTEGMAAEVKLAAELDIAVIVYNKCLYEAVGKINKRALHVPGDLLNGGVGDLAIACEEIEEVIACRRIKLQEDLAANS